MNFKDVQRKCRNEDRFAGSKPVVTVATINTPERARAVFTTRAGVCRLTVPC